MTSKTIWVSVPMEATIRIGRSRGDYATFLRHDVAVQVGGVPAEAAPVCLRAHYEDARGEVSWRLYDNSLWRPLFRRLGEKVIAGAEVLSGDFNGPGDGSYWFDNPFGSTFRGIFGKSHVAPQTLSKPGDCTVLSSEPAEAEARAQRIGAEDLLEIGGIIHRRTTPPIWAVGVNDRAPGWPGEMDFVIPDLADARSLDHGFARFGPIERDAAEACYNEYFAAVMAQGSPDARDAVRCVTEVRVEKLLDFPEPDYRIDGCVEAWRRMGFMFDVVKIEQMPFRTLSLYVRFGSLVEAMREGGDENGALFEQLAGVCEELKAGFLEVFGGWPRVAAAQGTFDAIIAQYVSSRLLSDVDLDALSSGFGQ